MLHALDDGPLCIITNQYVLLLQTYFVWDVCYPDPSLMKEEVCKLGQRRTSRLAYGVYNFTYINRVRKKKTVNRANTSCAERIPPTTANIPVTAPNAENVNECKMLQVAPDKCFNFT